MSDTTSKKGLLNLCGRVISGRMKSVRMPVRLLVIAGVIFGVTAGLAVCVLSNYLGIVVRQARDAYVVYRLTGERDELRAARDRLEQEVVSLRTQHNQVADFQSTMKSRLDELHAIVESTTALGLFRREKVATPNRPVVANGKPAATQVTDEQKALAALLDAPTLQPKGHHNRRLQSVEQMKATNEGLGGAEIECRRGTDGKVSCTSSVTKENIAFEDVRASFGPAVITADGESWSGEQKEMIDRVNRYTDLLRVLPIGAPVAGKLSSNFGYRVSPFSHRSSLHEGIDISLSHGSRVRATGGGVVVAAEYDGTYGWMVDVAHTPELITRYAHLSRALVKKGQKVSRGQVIALSGSTGRSTGPHLHYEVRHKGHPKNPLNFVALADKLAKTL